jgi:hypothetical protein
MRETLIYLSHLDHVDTEKQVCDSERTDLILYLGIEKPFCDACFVCILNFNFIIWRPMLFHIHLKSTVCLQVSFIFYFSSNGQIKMEIYVSWFF